MPVTPATRFLTLLAVLVLVLAGCGDDARDVESGSGSGLPDGDARYVGVITSVTAFEPTTDDCIDPSEADPDGAVSDEDPPFCTDPDNDSLGHVLVEEKPGLQEGAKVTLRFDSETVILRADDSAVSATFDDLEEGDTVEAWVDGAVAESYPEQATASAVLITR